VGLGTVSRVLNNSSLVSQETRQRVLHAIDELQYTPSLIARGLSLGKTLSIATVAPFFTRPSVVERLRGIDAAIAVSAYQLIVFNIETADRRDMCLRDLPRSDRVDGVLIISLRPHADEAEAMAHGRIPVVLIDSQADGLASTGIDDCRGGYIATSYLIGLGHRKIAYISDTLETAFNFTSSRDRLQGYQRALAEAGIPFQPDYHRQGEHGRNEAHEMAVDLLRSPEPPTAIFAASDTQAMGVLEAARDLGLAVPQDLSVIGFDDIDIAEHLQLTTIRQQLFDSGVRGMTLLLNILNGTTVTPVQETLQTELVVRATTAPPAESRPTYV
jgi:DNA-binding LacI/PurR family transcriptional regulator